MSEARFVKETTYGVSVTDAVLPPVPQRLIPPVPSSRKPEGHIQLSKSNCRLSILAPKEIKKLFGCERIEVEVPSIELKFESGPFQSVDEDSSRGYKLPGSRVVNLKAGKYQVNLKRWNPIVKFETEAPEPRWPRIVAAALWVAKKAGMQSSTKVDIHCGPQDTSSLQVKFQ